MEGEKKRYTRQSEEREASLALLPPSFSFCHGCFYASLFCSFEICRVCSGGKRRGEKRRGDIEGERRAENGEVLRFFWMSQARVRRRGKDEQEAGQRRGSGRKRRRKRKKHREIAPKRERERESCDVGLVGREREDPKRGQRENDKGERGGRFDWKGRQRGLFPFTSVFSVLRSVLSVVPARARAPTAHTHTRYFFRVYTHALEHVCARACTHLHTRVLFPFCPPPRLSVDLLFYTSPPSTPFSFCASLSSSFHRLRSYCTYVRIFPAYMRPVCT